MVRAIGNTTLTVVEAATIAAVMQSLLMGVYLASFFLCLRWLLFSDDGRTLRKRIDWALLSIAIALFALSATSFSLFLLLFSMDVDKSLNRSSIQMLETLIYVIVRHTIAFDHHREAKLPSQR